MCWCQGNVDRKYKCVTISIGTVKHLDIRWNSLCSTGYVKFDDSKAGNSMVLETVQKFLE